MAGVRLILLYPRPVDTEKFERDYEEHLSWAPGKIPGLMKLMVGRVLGTPSGEAAPFHRVAELYFSSMAALQDALNSKGMQEAVADAVAISTGGAPVVLMAEEEQPVTF
jgi:uncharacterized protein (TIGR02118 family)